MPPAKPRSRIDRRAHAPILDLHRRRVHPLCGGQRRDHRGHETLEPFPVAGAAGWSIFSTHSGTADPHPGHRAVMISISSAPKESRRRPGASAGKRRRSRPGRILLGRRAPGARDLLDALSQTQRFGKVSRRHSAGASEKKAGALSIAGVSSCHEPSMPNKSSPACAGSARDGSGGSIRRTWRPSPPSGNPASTCGGWSWPATAPRRRIYPGKYMDFVSEGQACGFTAVEALQMGDPERGRALPLDGVLAESRPGAWPYGIGPGAGRVQARDGHLQRRGHLRRRPTPQDARRHAFSHSEA